MCCNCRRLACWDFSLLWKNRFLMSDGKSDTLKSVIWDL